MPHSDPRLTKSTTPKPKRRALSADQINALSGALTREYSALDPSDPRRKPSLPTLRFMQHDGEEGGAS
jgi:hypothetical protein